MPKVLEFTPQPKPTKLITASADEIRTRIDNLDWAANTLRTIQRRGRPTEREILDLLVCAVDQVQWMREQVACMIAVIKAESESQSEDS